MDEVKNANRDSRYAQIWPSQCRDRYALAILLVLVLILRLWMLWKTEIPSRDGLYFIRYALLFERQDWREVIQQSFQHPGYPVSVLLVSWPVRWLWGATDCVSMQLSAQLASALAGWLLVVPMFRLGKQLFGRSVGFWATLLFQCLPESCQVLSDALSDPLWLLLACTALAFGVRALKDYAPRCFCYCGVSCGLAYLVRPEGLLVALALAFLLAARQVVRESRQCWRSCAVGLTSLLASTILVGCPYVLITGKLTNKPSSQALLQQMAAQPLPQDVKECHGPALFASVLAVHLPGEVEGSQRLWQAGVAVGSEFIHAYQYFGWLPVLVGVWWCRDRRRVCPGHWLMLAVFLTQALAGWLLAVNLGYVSTRHILPMVLVSIFQATAVILRLPYRLADWRLARTGDGKLPLVRWRRLPSRVALGVMASVIVLAMTRLTDTQHDYRKGHLSAGQWLIAHAASSDAIYDDHSWALYYTGRLFPRAPVEALDAGVRQSFFVVSRIGERHAEARPGSYCETDLQHKGGTIVYAWPEASDRDQALIVIYRLLAK